MGTRRRHGAQGAHDTPSKQTLEYEFGTQNEDEVLVKILEGGIVQETEVGFLFRFFFFFFSILSPSSPVLFFSLLSNTACVHNLNQDHACIALEKD